jgi:cell division protein FtsZ
VIYSSDEHQVTISELSDINLFMEDMAIDVEVLWGLYRDNSLGEEVKVVLIATDFVSDENNKVKSEYTNYDEKQRRDLLIQAYYGDLSKKAQKKDTEQTEVTVAEFQATTSEDENQECIQVAEEGNNEEKNVDSKETFLNRFIRKLGDIMESVE